MLRIAAILLSALWLSGCFVADEIRHGDALIEQHSVGWRKKKEKMQHAEEEVAKAEAEAKSHQAQETGPGVKGKLADWWHENVVEEPAKVDPEDKIVSCEIGGKQQFLRRSDCELRRGRTAGSKTAVKSSSTTDPKRPPGV